MICQHTHCIGCEEKWKDGTIVYGQGNFLFDHSESEFWQTSVVVQVDIIDRTVEYIPIQKDGNGVKLAVGNDAGQILGEMQARSEQIRQEKFVEKEYAEFANRMIAGYMSRDWLLTKNLVFRVLNKLSGYRISQMLVQKRLRRNRMPYINQYECEAHRELILKGLEMSVK